MAEADNSQTPSSRCTKAKGVCSVCRATQKLHIGNGHVHLHGPRSNICTGSHKPPLSVIDVNDKDGPDLSQSNQGTRSDDCEASRIVPSPICPSAPSQPCISHPCLPRGTIRHIPASARPKVANLLAAILNKINSNPNNLQGWSALFCFGAKILALPKHGGRRRNVASLVKSRASTGLSDFESDCFAVEPLPVEDASTKPTNHSKGTDWVAKSVATKIEDGNIAAAVRILCSDEQPITPDPESFRDLCSKHPSATQSSPIYPPIPADTACLRVTPVEVLNAIRSFPAGSSGGPDGIKPQHISELLKHKPAADSLLSSVTEFVNTLLSGLCPAQVRPFLFGGNLIALRKKSGGTRPIAIGYLWRRLVAKCANRFAIGKLSPFLAPLQLGVGVSGGCEAAVHTTRRFISSMSPDDIVTKLDFSNAFNSIHRSAFLSAVLEQIPEIFTFCHLAYAQPSLLRFGDFTISSEVGVQQGDPLGPLLFCLPLQPILNKLNSPLRFSYLDDLTLGGAIPIVASDIDLLISESSRIGLSLNFSKCEVISLGSTSTLPFPISDFISVNCDEASLLGAPLGGSTATTKSLSAKFDELTHGLSRLHLIARHDALVILRLSLNYSKLSYILRCNLCHGHPTLSRLDEAFRNSFSSVFNLSISETEWTQASLPVADGGLGIRLVSQLALPAFLASAAGTSNIQLSILSRLSVDLDPCFSSALGTWLTQSDQTQPSDDISHKQNVWDRPLIDFQVKRLKDSITSNIQLARLAAISSPHASDWLYAIPSSNCGTKLDDDSIRVALGLRLGSKLSSPHTCRCGTLVTSLGTHGLSCHLGPIFITRHNALNDIIHRSLIKAGIPAVKEPPGLSRADGKRPDGSTIIPWERGLPAVWDVTVIDTLAESYVNRAAITPASVAEFAAERKRLKYSNSWTDLLFIPIAFETLGPLDEGGTEFLSKLGRMLCLSSGDKRESSFLFQRLSVTLQRFNAAAILSTLPFPHPEREPIGDE